MAKAEVKIAIEPSIHKILAELATKIWKDYNIQLSDVSFDWQNRHYDRHNLVVNLIAVNVNARSYPTKHS